jgi:hypothetical protein
MTTGNELTRQEPGAVDLYLSGLSSLQVAAMIGRSKSWVLIKIRKAGVARPLAEAIRNSPSHRAARLRSGKDCPRWKGGVKRTGDGRYLAVMDKTHPSADVNGYVLEHRIIAEGLIGRFLQPQEDVHHINGDHSDNRPENLQVMSRSDHMAIHAKTKQRSSGGFFVKESI